jgi:hypothetical protein
MQVFKMGRVASIGASSGAASKCPYSPSSRTALIKNLDPGENMYTDESLL